MEKKRLQFIDGYKGFLCFMILLGHFWNIYRLTSGASPLDHAALDAFTAFSTRNLFIVASFWLYAFLVISGYLLSFSKIKNTGELLTKSVSRFLRLFIPVFGACLFIFLISKTVGFYAEDTAAFFKNTWFQKYYRNPFVFKDIFTESLKAMFSGSCAFNAPFWVIRDMLISSVLMYICKFTDSIYNKRTHVLPLLFTLCSLFMDNQVMTACFAGFLIGYYEEGLGRLTAKFRNFLVVFLAVYGFFLWMKTEKVLPSLFDDVTNYTLIHCFLLIALNRLSGLQRLFSAKPFLLAGKISFGVYSFHWPIICSVGSIVLLEGLRQQWHPFLTLGGAFLVTVLCAITLSAVYYFTVEKIGDLTVRGVRILGAKLPE